MNGSKQAQSLHKITLSQYDFEEVCQIYLNDVCSVAIIKDIRPFLVVNWDKTDTHFGPFSQWTMEVKGAERIEITGLNDKCQMTLVLAGTASEEFLPLQLI